MLGAQSQGPTGASVPKPPQSPVSSLCRKFSFWADLGGDKQVPTAIQHHCCHQATAQKLLPYAGTVGQLWL